MPVRLLRLTLFAVLAVTGVPAALAQPSALPIEPGSEERPPGTKWALLIGIDVYHDFACFRPLKYGASGVRKLRDTLIEKAGYEPRNVLLMTSGNAETQLRPVDRKGIEKRLKTWLAAVNQEDTVLFCFSGHGVRHEGQDYLAPMSADAKNIRESCLPVGAVFDLLAHAGAKQVLVITDACRNILPEGMRGMKSSEFGADAAVEAQKRELVIMQSCKPGEVSLETDLLSDAIYSHYLREGLSGAADGAGGHPRDGAVTVFELQEYLAAQVPQWCQAHADKLPPGCSTQTPWITLAGTRVAQDFALAGTPKAPAPPATAQPALPPPAVEERALPAKLKVTGEPAGASVFVDGELKGKVPCEVEIASVTREPKAFQIAVQQEAFQRREWTVKLAAGQEMPLEANLAKLEEATARPAPATGLRATMAFEDTDLDSVLRVLEAQLGAKIEARGLAPRSVSLRLDSATVEDALTLICGQTGLAWERTPEGYVVRPRSATDPASPSTPQPAGTQMPQGTIMSHLGHPGPPWDPGVTPSTLGWGPDDKPYPSKFVVNLRDRAEMVWVPAGSFSMGSEDGYNLSQAGNEKPVHKVTLSPFWLYKHEVTNAQFARLVSGSRQTAEFDWQRYYTAGRENYPVISVSWDEAAAYAARAGGALPTEAQWEYAARGPKARVYPWGDDWDARKFGNSGWSPPYPWPFPVGSFPADVSWCGALDLAGNAVEWCADWYGPYQSGSQHNPLGPNSGYGLAGWKRVVRGGNWGFVPGSFRGAYRDSQPHFGSSAGLRCAVSVQGQ
jgi:formylglycine-generating enzyme required for sulfatase activity